MNNRVVVTGLGTISALGNSHHEFWENLVAGKSGINSITQVDCTDMRFNQGYEVKHYDPELYFSSKQLTWLDRFAQFAVIAAKEAVEDANISLQTLANSDTGVITGTCLGGQNTQDFAFLRLYQQNNKRGNPNVVPNVMANAAASHIASTFKATGPSFTLSTACASSTHAIGHAFWLIRSGLLKRAITGGSEAPFSAGHLRAWEALRVISATQCRPFCKKRSGMVLGEGGGIILLESLDSALERKAHIYAEIIGFAMSADGNHLTDPDTKGQTQAVAAALMDAQLRPEQVQYINAHGTGTIMNDKIESQTIYSIFKSNPNYKVSSTKGAHGHLLGATGAVEAIATILALKHQIIPPTANFLEEDSDCPLPLAVEPFYSYQVEHALSSSFAFGGLNAVLVMKKWS